MPIKRHPALIPLSREHHYGLLLCWKIRKGVTKNIAPARIKQYATWFWNNHLLQHFEEEEQLLFPILPADSELRNKAIAEHQHIARFFEQKNCESADCLLQLAQCLDDHIRFEERILFVEIEKAATPQQLAALEKYHKTQQANPRISHDSWLDEFWKN